MAAQRRRGIVNRRDQVRIGRGFRRAAGYEFLRTDKLNANFVSSAT